MTEDMGVADKMLFQVLRSSVRIASICALSALKKRLFTVYGGYNYWIWTKVGMKEDMGIAVCWFREHACAVRVIGTKHIKMHLFAVYSG